MSLATFKVHIWIEILGLVGFPLIFAERYGSGCWPRTPSFLPWSACSSLGRTTKNVSSARFVTVVNSHTGTRTTSFTPSGLCSTCCMECGRDHVGLLVKPCAFCCHGGHGVSAVVMATGNYPGVWEGQDEGTSHFSIW